MSQLRRSILLAAATCAALSACHDDPPTTDAGVGSDRLRVLDPASGVVAIKPGNSATVRLALTSAVGAPLVGRTVRFAIFGDPRGSTLTSDKGVSGEGGVVAVRIQAGAVASRFAIRAEAGQATFAVPVEVSSAGFGMLRLATSYQGTVPTTKLVLVRLLLVDRQNCATVDRVKPAAWLRRHDVAGVGIGVLFSSLPVDRSHTFLAQGFSGDQTLLAAGCVDLPAQALKADQQARLTVQLSDLRPNVVGRYTLTSKLTLPRTTDGGGSWPRPMVAALRPWDDLVDCPNDPAQVLLDCVVDALDTGDPLDCRVEQPSAVASAVAAERGQLNGTCRADVTARGSGSLDRTLAAAMRSSGAATLSSVAALGNDARALLAIIGLTSTLEVAAPDSAGVAVASHALNAITLGSGAGAPTFSVEKVGLSRWKAVSVRAKLTNWNLSLASHGFSLRYGLLVQTALDEAIKKRKLGNGSSDLAEALVGLVTASVGGKQVTGCDALGVVVCDAARLGDGCLGKACSKGVAALATHLGGGIAGLDKPTGPALTLDGNAALQDTDGDLKVDTVGVGTIPGNWTAELTLAGQPVTPAEATFTGKRAK